MNKPLGFLSPMGVLVALLALVGMLGLTLIAGPILFSPGDLSGMADAGPLGGVGSHAELTGRCSACHPAPWSGKSMADQCLGCHQDVAAQIGERAGLHGGLSVAHAAGTCRGCHTEHNGANGALTVLDAGAFPHQLTGYSLQAHLRAAQGAALACADCHAQGLSQFDVAVCAECHVRLDAGYMQSHQATFGSQCVPCHDGVDRYGRSFDHNALPFALAGKHADLACAKCHADATSVEALQRTPQDCFPCHQKDDAHQARLGAQCAGCHTPEDWKKATFDHSKSAFPLLGAHVSLKCEQCHANDVFKGTATDCAACHAEPAFHADAFGNQSRQCASCHTTTGWAPAQFALAHARFPLDHGERRQAASCKTCHPTTVKEYTCYGCHEHSQGRTVAEHAEEGISVAEMTDCMRCHEGGREGDDGDGGGDDD